MLPGDGHQQVPADLNREARDLNLNLPNYQNPADLRLPLDLPRRAPTRTPAAYK